MLQSNEVDTFLVQFGITGDPDRSEKYEASFKLRFAGFKAWHLSLSGRRPLKMTSSGAFQFWPVAQKALDRWVVQDFLPRKAWCALQLLLRAAA